MIQMGVSQEGSPKIQALKIRELSTVFTQKPVSGI